MVHTSSLILIVVTSLLAPTTVVLVHGHDNHAGIAAGMGPVPTPMSAASINMSSTSPQSYFTYPSARGLILGHIVLMTLAWFLILPIGEPSLLLITFFPSTNQCVLGVMLSVARSRLALPAQISFLGLHTVALLLGTVYSSKTPDLYQNNAHNKIGWIITWILVAQCITGLLKLAVSFQKYQDVNAEEEITFLPISTQTLAQHNQTTYSPDEYHYSRDSGHYTASEASRSPSVSSLQQHEYEEQQKLVEYQNPDADIDAENMEKQDFRGNTRTQRVALRIADMLSQRTMRALNVAYNAIDCVSLLLGFIAIVSGVVVYGGVFVSYAQCYYPRHCQG